MEPVGIVGITGNHPATFSILSYNMHGNTAWAQVKSTGAATTAYLDFYILYA